MQRPLGRQGLRPRPAMFQMHLLCRCTGNGGGNGVVVVVIDIAVIGAIGTGIVRTTIHTVHTTTGDPIPTILITDIAGGIGVVRTSVSI